MTAGLDNLYVGVIDDDESQRRALRRLLRAAGMQSIAYASAEEFRSDLKQPRFHCLLVDVQLPGISGIELRDQLAAEGIVTPVLFVTAHDNPKARAQAMAGPCVGYFRKTDSPNEILKAIRKEFHRWRWSREGT
jgi:FixJ family two-component response regulator